MGTNVFLSHASNDKPFVNRLNKSLRSNGFSTWLDHKDIPFGGSIAGEIQNGLVESSVMIVVLSQSSVVSKWVSTEWQAKLFRHMKDEKVGIIPLIIDDCEPPPLLAGLKQLDFRDVSKYDDNLQSLVRALRKHQESPDDEYVADQTTSVFGYMTEILNELEDEFIALPFKRKLPIVGQLKKIPRSGKKVRLARIRQKLPARTVYDHLLSMAHVADCLLPEINHGIPDQERSELARCIAFHELNEVILGDIPTYTNLTSRSRQSTRNYAELRLSTVEPAIRERIANEFIWLFLGEKQRLSMRAVINTLDNERSKLYIAFKMLDKLDPILAVWRYLHHYRGKLGPKAYEFNTEMKDFYENPDVKSFLRKNKADQKVIDLASKLQDRELAGLYYVNREKLLSKRPFEIRMEPVMRMIEGIPLYSKSPPTNRRSRR
jgi:5'-deoxynucleotidase YfbR-like HD superfamily hydrolase